MRLRVLYHGNCFDGCSSAGVFTRFYRERDRQGAGRGRLPRRSSTRATPQPFAARLLRRRRERLRRLPLLAGPAADLVVRPPRLGVPAAGRRGPLPRRRHRPQVLRSDGEELHEVPGRHRGREVRLRRRAAAPSWSTGRRSSTARCSPTPQMAVELKEPALRLMTFIENNRDPALAERFIGDLVEPAAGRDRRRPVRRRAAGAAARAAPAQHRGHPRGGQAGGRRGLLRPGRPGHRRRSTSSSPTTCSPRRATRWA